MISPLILLIIALILFFAGLIATIIAICLGVALMLCAGALAMPKTPSNTTYVPIPIPIFLK